MATAVKKRAGKKVAGASSKASADAGPVADVSGATERMPPGKAMSIVDIEARYSDVTGTKLANALADIIGEPKTPQSLAALNPYMQMFGFEATVVRTAEFSLVVENVPREYANALRVMLCNEQEHAAFVIDDSAQTSEDLDCYTERYMSREQVATYHIPQIPLTREALVMLDNGTAPEFYLDVENRGVDPVPVYAGHLRVKDAKGELARRRDIATDGMFEDNGLFDPTIKIANLSPGARIYYGSIRIERGRGIDHARYLATSRVVGIPLDLPRAPAIECTSKDGPHRDHSGFLVASAVADPYRHVIRGIIRAATPGCRNDLLSMIKSARQQLAARLRAASGIEPAVSRLADGITAASLFVPGESFVIGEMISRAAYDNARVETGGDSLGALSYVGYTSDDTPGAYGGMRIELRATDDAGARLRAAIDTATNIIDI